MNKFRLLISCLVVLFFWKTSAQQDPQYTQYRYNLSVVNPAYAGSKGWLSLAALYRKQWSKFEGAPETITFSGHMPLGGQSGIGLSAIKDKLGPVEETNVYADYSYTLDLENFKFAFGLKAGLTFHNVGLTDLETTDPNDPLFAENIANNYPNIGAGVFLYSDEFFAGFSIPNFLNSVHLDENGIRYGSERNHFFLVGGMVKEISDDLSLRPSILFKSAIGAPLSLDINFSALFYEKFELGASYRLDDSFSGLAGFYITETLMVGYAYDLVLSTINEVAPSSHEIVLTFDLGSYSGRRIAPRFR